MSLFSNVFGTYLQVRKSDFKSILASQKNELEGWSFWFVGIAFFSAILVYVSAHIPFFWDNILQGSRCADFYYQSGFAAGLVLPAALDAGHPPVFPIWLALCWLAFGKTLLVSHLAIWPAVFGVLWQSALLAHRFLGKWWAWGLILVLLDASLAAQMLQISPDMYLLFFYLMAINSILDRRPIMLLCVLPLLAMISSRGTLALVALGLSAAWVWLYPYHYSSKIFWTKTLGIFIIFVPAGLVVVFWQYYHYQKTGWSGYNPDSEWALNYQMVSGSGALRNAAILVWRLADMGRLWLWILIVGWAGKYFFVLWKNKNASEYFSFGHFYKIIHPYNYNTSGLVMLLLIPLLVWSPFFIFYANGTGHRYLLVCNIFAGLAAARILFFHIKSIAVYVFSLFFVLGGWFWIYPDSVAKGWDATPAHLPYYALLRQAKQTITDKQIAYHQVAASFPALDAGFFTDLNQDSSSFVDYSDHPQAQFLLWSNIFNGFDDQMLARLKEPKHYKPIWRSDKGFVQMVLYQKNQP